MKLIKLFPFLKKFTSPKTIIYPNGVTCTYTSLLGILCSFTFKDYCIEDTIANKLTVRKLKHFKDFNSLYKKAISDNYITSLGQFTPGIYYFNVEVDYTNNPSINYYKIVSICKKLSSSIKAEVKIQKERVKVYRLNGMYRIDSLDCKMLNINNISYMDKLPQMEESLFKYLLLSYTDNTLSSAVKIHITK